MKTTGKTSVQTTLVQRKLEDLRVQKESRSGTRRFLQTLQHSAVDKENLVAGGNMKDVTVDNDTSLAKATTQSSKNKADKGSNAIASMKNDLTTDAPSENYWEQVAEKRRLALEEALKENKTLHSKVKLLEEENEIVKTMMQEATELVETLTEIVQEKVDGDDMDFSLNISK